VGLRRYTARASQVSQLRRTDAIRQGAGNVRGNITDVATTATGTRACDAELLSEADGLSRQSDDLGGAVTGFLNALKTA
jgi:hypothetical protein